MQDLLLPKAYPENLRKVIQAQSQVGIELANRWMLGWPGRVKALIAAKQYQVAFEYQVDQERNILETQKDYTHLARHELMELFDQPAYPPTLD